MNKSIKRYLLIIVLLLGGIFLFQKINWLPSFSEIFTAKEIVIDNTPILVKEINNLAQLVTITAYNEVVIDSIRKGKEIIPNPITPIIPIPGISLSDDRIVLIGKGKILAGVDLAKLKETDVVVKDDSVSIKLPPAEILQVITNPSDFETFSESGYWNNNEVTAVKNKLRNKLTAAAIQQKILPQAANKAKLIMESFLRKSGYKKVTVII